MILKEHLYRRAQSASLSDRVRSGSYAQRVGPARVRGAAEYAVFDRDALQAAHRRTGAHHVVTHDLEQPPGIRAEAGFELREPGCSACLGMNEDKIPKGEYCVSTSNRNFEGRQGPGARTMLVSPLTAAVIAVEGKIVDAREHIGEGALS